MTLDFSVFGQVSCDEHQVRMLLNDDFHERIKRRDAQVLHLFVLCQILLPGGIVGTIQQG